MPPRHKAGGRATVFYWSDCMGASSMHFVLRIEPELLQGSARTG